MRLLNCRSKTLKVFSGDHAPRYAILSHTWEEEEVVYEDLIAENIGHTKKRGWYKIEKACEQAIQDRFEYLWVDTLCIDKSSSSELSEAINSMFNWYRDSLICYAYPSDLPRVALADSRWFTRGWTLQEMIAPRNIHFYDRLWAFQGSKSTLADQLHRITGVDHMVLGGGDLRLISVARKISWASRRKTTRSEDMAYSLLGLFGISMPMLYGEGNRAFIRLQEEIVKQYDDQTIFAWRVNPDNAAYAYGLFADSPEAFSDSANMVVCHSYGHRTESVTISNRGIRIVAPLHEVTGQRDRTFIVKLDCKLLHFDTEVDDRIGIVVTQGLGDVYSRIMAYQHQVYAAHLEGNLATIFGWKERVYDDSRLLHSLAFWVRTLPSWPNGQDYQLAGALPRWCWDSEQKMFRVPYRLDSSKPPCLVFHRAASTGTDQDSYFLVFFNIPDFSQGVFSALSHVSCAVEFYSQSNSVIKDVLRDLESGLEWLSHEPHPQSWGTCSQDGVGGGVTLKCQVQLKAVGSNHVCVADIQAKADEA